MRVEVAFSIPEIIERIEAITDVRQKYVIAVILRRDRYMIYKLTDLNDVFRHIRKG